MKPTPDYRMTCDCGATVEASTFRVFAMAVGKHRIACRSSVLVAIETKNG